MGTSSAASSSSSSASSASAAAQPGTVVVACRRCGAKNRVERGRAEDEPRCGRCQALLALGDATEARADARATSGPGAGPAHPVTVTEATFASEVERSSLPVLVDFWAPWCGPCRAVAPVLDKIAGERAGKLKIAKVNVDENPRLAARFRVQAIPTMIVFKNGQVVEQIRGALPKAALDAKLAAHV